MNTVIMSKIDEKSINQRITHNFLWSFLTEAVSKSILFLANIILARRLGVEAFGLFTFAQTTIFYVWVGSDVGTYMYGIREISRNRPNEETVINPVLTMKLCFGAIIFILYTLSIICLVKNLNLTQRLTFIGCGVYLVTYPTYIDWVLKGMEKFHFLVFATFLYSMAFLASIMYVVKDGNDVVIAAFIWSISFLFGGVPLFFILKYKLKKNYRISFKLSQWGFHLRKSVFFALSGILSMAYNYIPIFIMGVMLGNYDIGIFSVSYKLISVLSAPGYYISMAIFPIISDLYARSIGDFKRLSPKFFAINLSLGLLMALFCFVFAETLILTLFGKQYVDSICILKILAWILPLQFIRYIFSSSIASTEYQKFQAIPIGITIIFFAAILNLIPISIKYISIATVLSELVLVISYFLLSEITNATR